MFTKFVGQIKIYNSIRASDLRKHMNVMVTINILQFTLKKQNKLHNKQILFFHPFCGSIEHSHSNIKFHLIEGFIIDYNFL